MPKQNIKPKNFSQLCGKTHDKYPGRIGYAISLCIPLYNEAEDNINTWNYENEGPIDTRDYYVKETVDYFLIRSILIVLRLIKNKCKIVRARKLKLSKEELSRIYDEIINWIEEVIKACKKDPINDLTPLTNTNIRNFLRL